MKIGIIGAGNIGATAARLFAAAGHEVAIANSRGPQTLEGLVNGMDSNAQAASVEKAAEFGEVVMEAIPFGRYAELPAQALSGKVLVTASNYYPARDGEIEFSGRTQSELIAEHLPGARVVKAFNTIYFRRLAENGRLDAPLEEREVIFLAGDDKDAVAIVSGLIEDIGFAPMVTGAISESTRQQPGSAIYNVRMTTGTARETLSGMS